jgi:hypothetical protein
MKGSFFIIIISVCVLSSFAQPAKKKVVMQEAIGKNVPEEVKNMIMRSVKAGLVHTNKYTILENRQVMAEKQTEESAFQNEGWTNDNQRLNIGNISGADINCYAEIEFYEGNYYLTCNLTNLETGEVFSSFSYETKNGDVRDLCNRLTSDIAAGRQSVTARPNTEILCPNCCWDGSRFVDGSIFISDERATTWYEANKICEQKGEGWYLPSKGEMLNIYRHRADIIKEGGQAFNNKFYWTSTIDSRYDSFYVDFQKGMADYDSNNAEYSCRCIKK